jgi:hypothetical protein
MSFRNWPLRWKMLALLLSASAVPLAVMALIAFRNARDQVRSSAIALLEARSEQIAASVDEFNAGLRRATERDHRTFKLRLRVDAPDNGSSVTLL